VFVLFPIFIFSFKVSVADAINKGDVLNLQHCIDIIKKGIGEIWYESNIKG
jgi:hypothetical protein